MFIIGVYPDKTYNVGSFFLNKKKIDHIKNKLNKQSL